MTTEELKAEAKKQGYGIHKLQPYVPIKRCKCGKKPMLQTSISGAKKYVCANCGLHTSWYKSDKAARLAWNGLVQS